MKKSIARVVVSTALAGFVLTGAASAALADPVIVDQPDTGGLNNTWTFAPLGVPVLGLVQSIVRAPNVLLPN
jgi:hypothetical protein